MHHAPHRLLTFTPKALLNPLAKKPPKGAMRDAKVERTRAWSMAGYSHTWNTWLNMGMGTGYGVYWNMGLTSQPELPSCCDGYHMQRERKVMSGRVVSNKNVSDMH